MKRFAALIVSTAVFAIMIAGCGEGGGAGTTAGTEDQSNWGEAKKYEAQLEKKLQSGESKYLKKKKQ